MKTLTASVLITLALGLGATAASARSLLPAQAGEPSTAAGGYVSQPAKAPGNNRYDPYGANAPSRGQAYASGYLTSAAAHNVERNRYVR